MAPKRKRPTGNHQSSDPNDNSPRPSPHRPGNLSLAQPHQSNAGYRGGRRPSARHNGRASNAGSTPTSPAISKTTNDTHSVSSAPSSRQPPSAPVNMITAAKPSPASLSRVEEPAWIMTLPIYYDYITDDIIAQWKDSGRQAVLSAALQQVEKRDLLELGDLFQEIVRAVMAEKLRPTDAGGLLKEIFQNDAQPEDDLSISRQFIDCFATMTESGLPNAPRMREFLEATAIPPTLLREQFEASLLTQLGLVRPTFSQMGTRYSTNVLYKLPTYNLLREDTEGYSKLISEYYHCAERGQPTAELVSDTFQKVKALIGAFNLDSGRSLDITLDVFGDLLIKRHRFFVRYLRASSFWPQKHTVEGLQHDDPGFNSLPWWTTLDYPGGHALTEDDRDRLLVLKESRDVEFWSRVRKIGIRAFFELDGRRVVGLDDDMDDTPLSKPSTEQDDVRHWVTETKTYPPLGNKMAAQLLGYKLRYYASEIRGDSQLPENLIWLAALLIHIGFISLKDLYPHLYPFDENMAEVEAAMQREKQDRENKKRPGGGENPLTRAKPLTDDTLPLPSKLRDLENATGSKAETPIDLAKAEDDSSLPEPRNQKLLLVESLLLIGAIPDALFIIGKFPWILDLQPSIHKYIHRILHHSISHIYIRAQPLPDRKTDLTTQKVNVGEQSGPAKGYLKPTRREPRRTLRWGKLDEYDSTKESDFKFYWDDWSDNVPICRTVDDLFTLCASFLGLTGLRIGEDSELLGKIARIGSHSLSEDDSEVNCNRWIDLCKRLLVPALSFTKSNPGVVNQVWEMMRSFPISVRYSIYAEWSGGASSRTTAMRDARKLSEDQTKDVLKRISKENTREMAKALAKIAMSSPCVVFQHALYQVQSYSNLIAVVIECARYFTSMAYDVLTWSILAVLGNSGGATMQADGMLTSIWLRQLSVFTGDVCKRYSVMSPSPILCYVTQQLRDGRSDNLELLEQVITSMAGIKTELAYNQQQLQYLMGGPIVREIVLKQLQDKRFDSRVSSKRLIKSLQESNLLVPILLLLAQERQQYVFRNDVENAPLKVLGNNQDKIHGAFVQYLETLRYNLSELDFGAVVPSVTSLIKDFGLQAPLAFLISRDGFRRQMTNHREAIKASKTETIPVATDVDMVDVSKETSVINDAKVDLTQHSPEPIESGPTDSVEKPADAAEDSPVAAVMIENSPGGLAIDSNPPVTAETTFHPIVQSLAEELQDVLRPNFDGAMSTQFYTWFWQLGAYDIHYPKETYNVEQDQLKAKVTKLAIDRRDVSQAATLRREAEKKKLMDVQQGLINETRLQMLQNTVVKRELRKEKDQWFSHLPLEQFRQLSENIIQDCIFPRALLSPQDAYYTAKFIFLVHGLGPVAFRTILIIDCLFRVNFLEQAIFSCTAREAENFGWFLNELLAQLHRWHTKINKMDKNPEDLYNQEAFGSKKNLPGFCSKIKADLTPDSPLSWEDYRRILFKWHGFIMKALQNCLASSEYMHIRNAIVVLKTIHTQFPRITFQGDKLTAAVTEISRKDERQDLKLSALSLLGDLKKKQKDWILPQAFRNAADPAMAKAQPASDTAASKAQPTNARSTDGQVAEAINGSNVFNPAVPDFKPSELNANSTTAKSAVDQEDGEVDDQSSSNKVNVEQSSTTSATRSQLPALAKNITLPMPPRGPMKDGADITIAQPALSSRNVPTLTDTERIPISNEGTASQQSLPKMPDLPKRPEGAIPRLERNAHLPPAPDRSRIDPRQSLNAREGPRSRLSGSHGQQKRDDFVDAGTSAARPRNAEQSSTPREPLDRPRASLNPEADHRSDTHQGRQDGSVPRDRGYDMSRTGPVTSNRLSAVSTSTIPQPRPPISQPAETQPSINPARAALISATQEKDQQPNHDRSRRHESDHPDREGRGARPSRPDGPRRPDESLGPAHGPSAMRPSVNGSVDRARGHDRLARSEQDRPSDRREDNRHHMSSIAPPGPRVDRSARPEDTSRDRPSDLFQTSNDTRAPMEPSNGRLSMNFASTPRPVQDQSYGRLNAASEAPTTSGPPSGPRARGAPPRQIGRNFTAPSPITTNQPPSPQFDRTNRAPAQDSHDSFRNAQYDSQSRGPPSQQHVAQQSNNPPVIAAVHPSRLGQVNVDAAMTHSPQPALHSPSLPVGPRMRQGGNAIQQPGPPPPNADMHLSGSDRRGPRILASVNNVLQQAGDSSNGGRGRGGRATNGPLTNAPYASDPSYAPASDNDRRRSHAPSDRQEARPGYGSERLNDSNHDDRLGHDQQLENARGGRRLGHLDHPADQQTRSRSPRRERESMRSRNEPPHSAARGEPPMFGGHDSMSRGHGQDPGSHGGRDRGSNARRQPDDHGRERSSRREPPSQSGRHGDMSRGPPMHNEPAHQMDHAGPPRRSTARHSHADDLFDQRNGPPSRGSGASSRNGDHDGRGSRGGDRRSDARKRRGGASDGLPQGDSKRTRRGD